VFFLLSTCFRERVISINLWPSRWPDLTPTDFYLLGAAQSAVYRDRPRTLNDLKTAITAYIRNISQTDLQKVFENEIESVPASLDAGGHYLQPLLQVHSDFPNVLYCILINLSKRNGYVMCHQFNIQQLYALSHCMCFVFI
jgi:hypothetical protein